MTKEQLVHSLRYCSAVGMCDDCALSTIQKEFGAPFCDDRLKSDAADLIEAQAAEIEKLKALVPRWIPVTDKIPPDQEEVLVLTQSKNGVRNVDKGYWAIDHFIHRGRSEVTHWMPLPEVEVRTRYHAERESNA